MNALVPILRIVVLLAVGALVGSILASILTGDPLYTIAWAVGIPAVILLGVFIGGRAKQAPADPVATPRRGSRALAIVLIVVGVALALLPSYRLIGWTATNLAQGRWDGNDMRSGLHQQEAIDQIAQVVGSYDFVSVNFYDGYVLVEAPTSTTATTTDTYEWRYGRASRGGPLNAVIDGAFDASRVDFSIVADVVAAAKADAGWDSFTSFYPSVRENDEGVPEIYVSLGNDYYSASYTYSIDGELLDRYGDGLD